METKPWFVYLLSTVEQPVKTYVGATIDVHRRLRQHNGELAGGARATSTVPGGWYRVCFIERFETESLALQFEWHWKNRSKRQSGDPLTRRRKALDFLLSEAKWKSLNLQVQYE